MITNIDGKLVSAEIRNQLKLDIIKLKEKNIHPKLAVILVGNDKSSQVYVRNKSKVCHELGILCNEYILPENTEEDKLLSLIDSLNNDPCIHGILVQCPLPKHLNSLKIINSINYMKDVDCLTTINIGKLHSNDNVIVKSCTPFGIMKLLEYYNIDIKGKKVVIIGRSNIVGRPLAELLLQKDATVTVCHSKTDFYDIKYICQESDIIISAVGKSNFVDSCFIGDNTRVIIDVGITRDENNKVCGDCNYKDITDKWSDWKTETYITPVPGGVGPMTITMLMYNLINLCKVKYL